MLFVTNISKMHDFKYIFKNLVYYTKSGQLYSDIFH